MGRGLKLGIKTKYGCFTHWWAALPAVPTSRTALDWWVDKPDGRCTPYDRLKRVWFDTTRLLWPKSDPCRPHEFAKPTHGTHLTCKTWESFSIFAPSDWIPRLLQPAGFEVLGTPVDCAWSYEFEAMVGSTTKFKLVDIVLHIRNDDGSESLIVFEVKRPGDKLKEDRDLPDTRPASYLDREAFHPIPDRKLIYLVDRAYEPVIREKVTQSDRRWGVLSWDEMEDIQISLAKVLLPEPVGRFVCMVLASQYDESGITARRHSPADFAGSEGFPTSNSSENWRGAFAASGAMPTRLTTFLTGACQYMDCLSGVIPSPLAFPYLAMEPSFQQIHGLPPSERQTRLQRRRPDWQLPSTATDVRQK